MALIDKVANSFRTKESAITNQVTGITYSDLTEPTYLVFEPIFNFNMQTGLLADESNVNSALAYLKRNNEMTRFNKLYNAIETLKIILSQSPWVFESVTGFNEALDVDMQDVEITEQKLLFTLWETLDMRVSNCIHGILDATYDYNVRQVEVLPRNLQEFSMGLLIHEVRVFNNVNNTASRALNQGEDPSGIAITKTNHTLLHFGKCRIKRSSGNSYMSEFSNVEVPEVKVNLEIEFKRIVRTHNFNTFVESVNNTLANEIQNNSNQNFTERVTNSLSNPNLGDYAGLVSSNVGGVNGIIKEGNQFDLGSYSAGGVTMQALKNQLNQSNTIAGAVINQANKAIGDGRRVSENIFENDNDIKGFIPKRLTVNAFTEVLDNYYEALKNPALWDVIHTLGSDTRVNSRRSINIFNEQ